MSGTPWVYCQIVVSGLRKVRNASRFAESGRFGAFGHSQKALGTSPGHYMAERYSGRFSDFRGSDDLYAEDCTRSAALPTIGPSFVPVALKARIALGDAALAALRNDRESPRSHRWRMLWARYYEDDRLGLRCTLASIDRNFGDGPYRSGSAAAGQRYERGA